MYTSKNVLIVEDQNSEIVLLTNLFQELARSDQALPITVTFAKTVQSARDLIKKIRFDLIFLDGDLTGNGINDEPDTLPLFKEIKSQYRNKIYSTTDSQHYQEIMEQFNCPHVKKEDIVFFADSFLRKTPPSYEIAVGKLIIVQLPISFQVYIGIIINVTPLLVKIHDTIAPLMQMDRSIFAILEDETVLIQGSPDEQRQLLAHYEKRVNKITINVAEIQERLALNKVI